jgi:hypothetical protein
MEAPPSLENSFFFELDFYKFLYRAYLTRKVSLLIPETFLYQLVESHVVLMCTNLDTGDIEVR